jgi:hypothetical protein
MTLLDESVVVRIRATARKMALGNSKALTD